MRHSLYLPWIVLFSLAAPSGARAAPRVVPGEPVFDAGTVPRGERVSHAFVLHNEGDETLEIREVRAACGCTVTEFDTSIAPGAEGRVRAVVDTEAFRGPIVKSVTVYTNDRATPALQLTIKADVQPDVDVMPGYVRYLHVRGGPPQTLTQHVWVHDGGDLEILGTESPFPYLQVRARRAGRDERHEDGPEQQWIIDATLAKNAPVGPLTGTVVVTTNHPRQGRLEIPVAGYVRPVLMVSPPLVDFGRFAADQPRRGSVLVTNYGEEAVQLTGVDTDVAGLTAEIEEREEGRSFAVLLTLKPGAPPGPLAGTLAILTDQAEMPRLEVPVEATIE